jgi:hypothetical protein
MVISTPSRIERRSSIVHHESLVVKRSSRI